MELSRLRLGEGVSGLAALGLLVVLFLAWDQERVGGEAGATASGWGSLGWPVLVLLLLEIGLAAALVVTTITKRPAAIPIGAAVMTTAVGIIVALVLLVRVLFLDDSLLAAYLGLALAVLIPVGSWIAMADERTEAPYSAAPDLPRRPAPSTEA